MGAGRGEVGGEATTGIGETFNTIATRTIPLSKTRRFDTAFLLGKNVEG
jgi:hypothetical protein